IIYLVVTHVSRKSTLMTDTAGGYMGVGKEFERHEMVDHGADEYVRGDAHSNTVESYFATLKRGINGVYHHASEAHLKRYLAEFDFRYNNRAKLGVSDGNVRQKLSLVSRANVSRIVLLTKPRTSKQKAKAFLRWRRSKG
ncbi:IS1595 family transposase, partial [Bradyrhizobium sp.]|uniref:IS1595 family transposase n=1 Tax=Bradyrhizobium sp. TaxID=376 RepID=UPI003C423A2A